MAPKMTHQSKFGMGAAEPVDQFFDVESCTIKMISTQADNSGHQGTRFHPKERKREQDRRVTGNVVFRPTPAEIDLIMPWVTGSAKVGSDFPLAEALTERFIWRTQGTYIYKWSGCKAGRTTITGSQGQPLRVSIDVEGIDEDRTALATAFPVGWVIDRAIAPYMFSDLVAIVNGVTTKWREIEVVIDNMLDGERFLNSLTRTALPEQDSNITCTLRGPIDGAEALYGLATQGVAVSAIWTHGAVPTVSFGLALPAVSFPQEGPETEGKEFYLPLRGTAGTSAGAAALVISNDSTP